MISSMSCNFLAWFKYNGILIRYNVNIQILNIRVTWQNARNVLPVHACDEARQTDAKSLTGGPGYVARVVCRGSAPPGAGDRPW